MCLLFFFYCYGNHRDRHVLTHAFPTRRSSDLESFRKDFAGRVARTGAFVQKQNLGSMDEVYRSARRVRSMHSVVNGFARDGLDFDADDPHQQAWVSMTLNDSILLMAERYGSGRLSTERAAQFVREQSTHGALLDPRGALDAIGRAHV